jgi:hypothetical protein
LDHFGNFEDNFFRSSDLPDINNITIDKRITSLKQIKKKDIELISLVYRQGIMRGFELEDLQKYIAIRTRYWIERNIISKISKREHDYDLKWFYSIARDRMAYIGLYRRCMDEIDECKRECWRIADDPKTTSEIKIKAFKELHQLSRTSILLARDLPFVTKLSNYFDHESIAHGNKDQWE